MLQSERVQITFSSNVNGPQIVYDIIKKQTPVETGVDKPKPTAYEKIVRNIFIEW